LNCQPFIECQNDLGEGPLWDAREGALFWLDINRARVQRYDPQTKATHIFEMPMRVTALGLRERGGFVCATEKGFYFWDGKSTSLEFITHPEEGKAGARFNDGKVDRAGRFWAGTMDPRNATSALYRLDTDLSARRMEEGITISNGIGWSPDNRKMYYADSLRYAVYEYTFDLQSGSISERRVFIQVEKDFGVPDGLTVDSQGYVWIAFYDGWKVVRYTPDGKEDARVALPVARPTCPAFGGPALDRLYVTTAIDGLPERELEQQPQAGDVFVIEAGVKGLAEPMFAG
jgi:sugar lactone lactonase YvrE